MALSKVENFKAYEQQPVGCSGSIDEFLSEGNFNKLQHIMYPAHVGKAGTSLFWEGDEATKLYYIHSGRVKLTKTTEDGKHLILSVMDQGDLVGEYVRCGNMLHSFTAEIIENAEVSTIQITDLEILLAQYGRLAVEFMNWLAVTNQKNQSKLRDLLLYGKTGAIASTLIRMSNTYGVVCKEGLRLEIKMTNTEMADFVGTTRESVNRTLNAWREKGIIGIAGGKIIIKHLNDLRCICNCPTYPACPKEICRL